MHVDSKYVGGMHVDSKRAGGMHVNSKHVHDSMGAGSMYVEVGICAC